jgi:hypothetical protein
MRSAVVCISHEILVHQIEEDEMSGACGKCRGFRVGKRNERGLPGRPRRRWEESIARGLKRIGQRGVVWISLAQDREKWRAFVSTGMNARAP